MRMRVGDGAASRNRTNTSVRKPAFKVDTGGRLELSAAWTRPTLWCAGQRPENFYMLGSMGLAVPIALGVALAQPSRQVIAREGDGSLLEIDLG